MTDLSEDERMSCKSLWVPFKSSQTKILSKVVDDTSNKQIINSNEANEFIQNKCGYPSKRTTTPPLQALKSKCTHWKLKTPCFIWIASFVFMLQNNRCKGMELLYRCDHPNPFSQIFHKTSMMKHCLNWMTLIAQNVQCAPPPFGRAETEDSAIDA
jgi:hypothetical protein